MPIQVLTKDRDDVGAHSASRRAGLVRLVLRTVALLAMSVLLGTLVRAAGPPAGNPPADAATGVRAAVPERLDDTGGRYAEPARPVVAPEPVVVEQPALELTAEARAELARQRRLVRLALQQQRHLERMQARLDALPEGYVELTGDLVGGATSFVVSSFNVLGHGHTKPGGNKPGFMGSEPRTRIQAGLLRRYGVSVVGLQEFTASQYHQLRRFAPEYEAFPGPRMGPGPVQNSIAWRRSEWTLVESGTIPVPYFHGNRIPMPHVLLRNNATGQEIWFGNYHNPASTRGNAQGYRNAATDMEASLANRLLATGRPVIMTGDMNEKAEFLCRFTATAPLHSADGGHRDGSGCHPSGRSRIDWIIGSGRVDFSGYVADDSPAVDRSTDHPMVRAQATVLPALVLEECVDLAPLGTWCPTR